MTTVSVTPIEGFQFALRMHWEKAPIVPDINQAFDSIFRKLDTSEQKVFILVDITNNPRFPIAVTLSRASQAHRHPNMGDWLVIGTNTMAKFIGTTISSMSSSKVIWFDNEQAALQHLASVTI